MINRNLLWIFCFLIGVGPVIGQVPVDPAIKARFDAFIEFSNKQQWDSAFNLIYPKLFARVPKQDLVDMMQRMQVGMTLRMENTHIIASSSPVQEGNETFVRLSYESDMKVAIDKGGMYDSPKAIQAIGDQFKSTYGGRSVQWDADLKQYNIRATKNMMAINPGNGDWKLVEINMEQPDLMEFLFSPSIMDELVRVE
jgi:hypothetical protein